jgi:hypothetical protein
MTCDSCRSERDAAGTTTSCTTFLEIECSTSLPARAMSEDLPMGAEQMEALIDSARCFYFGALDPSPKKPFTRHVAARGA